MEPCRHGDRKPLILTRKPVVRAFLKCFCPEGEHLADLTCRLWWVELLTHITTQASNETLKNIKEGKTMNTAKR